MGCSQETEEPSVINQTPEENVTQPPSQEDEEIIEQNQTQEDDQDESSSLLVLDKCEREDVFGVAIQYAGCTIGEQENIVSMEIANRGKLPIEGFYLYALNVTNDEVIAQTRLEEYVINGDIPLEPETVGEITYSLIDIEEEYDVPLKKIHLSPIVTLENGTQAACFNYRIGYKPYDCRHNRR
jgi:hypothetical protein